MTPAEVLASAAESLRREPESWYRNGTNLATVVANVPGAGLEERGKAAALLRAHLDGDPGDAHFLADWSKERGHEEAIEALEGAKPGCAPCDPEAHANAARPVHVRPIAYPVALRWYRGER